MWAYTDFLLAVGGNLKQTLEIKREHVNFIKPGPAVWNNTGVVFLKHWVQKGFDVEDKELPYVLVC